MPSIKATERRPDDNWQPWCHLTKSPCTAKIPAACLCAQMHPNIVKGLINDERS